MLVTSNWSQSVITASSSVSKSPKYIPAGGVVPVGGVPGATVPVGPAGGYVHGAGGVPVSSGKDMHEQG
jgi:hypothetical protein